MNDETEFDREFRPNMKFEEALREKPPWLQDEILGRKKAMLFRAGYSIPDERKKINFD